MADEPERERGVRFAPGTDPRLQEGYTILPNVVLRCPSLSMEAKAMYGILLSYAWQDGTCYPSQDRLAADIGASADTVQRRLRELVKKRYIDIRRRGLNRPNEYVILPLPDAADLRHPETANLRSQDAANLRHNIDSPTKTHQDSSKRAAVSSPAASEVDAVVTMILRMLPGADVRAVPRWEARYGPEHVAARVR